MTKTAIKPFIGRMVIMTWRDPQGVGGWGDVPLKDETARAETLCWPEGFNDRGELVVAGTRAGASRADRTAMPTACVESMQALAPKGKLRR